MKKLAFFVVVLLAACGGVDKKEDRPAPIVSRTPAQDAPPVDDSGPPPLGKPRAKVAPSGVTKTPDSLLHDETPH